MFRKLKRKFVLLATVSMLLLMTVLITIMNAVNYTSIVKESDAVLEMLSAVSTQTPEQRFQPDEHGRGKPDMPAGMSPEVPYESRYFTVYVSAEEQIVETDMSRIVSVDDTTVGEYTAKAMENQRTSSFVGNFRYEKMAEGQLTRIVFLDCGRKLDAFRTFLFTSIGVGVLGCLIAFGAFVGFSGKILRPVAESYDKQKRFITDAGHEMKTPLTVISANLDLLESDLGEKEEVSDIRLETGKLTKLTRDLVFLSKMEESGHQPEKVEFPISDLAAQSVESFHGLAAMRRVTFSTQIQPNLSCCGAPDSISRLISILLENAVKYSPEGGTISVRLFGQKKFVSLEIRNVVTQPIPASELPRLFDRFYRSDESRSSETGGHGIGLSIAKAVVTSHGGKITASSPDENTFCISVLLPS